MTMNTQTDLKPFFISLYLQLPLSLHCAKIITHVIHQFILGLILIQPVCECLTWHKRGEQTVDLALPIGLTLSEWPMVMIALPLFSTCTDFSAELYVAVVL